MSLDCCMNQPMIASSRQRNCRSCKPLHRLPALTTLVAEVGGDQAATQDKAALVIEMVVGLMKGVAVRMDSHVMAHLKDLSSSKA